MTSKEGKFIRAARAHLGLTLPEFGELIGTTRQTVWRYERGEPVPYTTRLAVENLLIAHEAKQKSKRKRSRK